MRQSFSLYFLSEDLVDLYLISFLATFSVFFLNLIIVLRLTS